MRNFYNYLFENEKSDEDILFDYYMPDLLDIGSLVNNKIYTFGVFCLSSTVFPYFKKIIKESEINEEINKSINNYKSEHDRIHDHFQIKNKIIQFLKDYIDQCIKNKDKYFEKFFSDAIIEDMSFRGSKSVNDFIIIVPFYNPQKYLLSVFGKQRINQIKNVNEKIKKEHKSLFALKDKGFFN